MLYDTIKNPLHTTSYQQFTNPLKSQLYCFQYNITQSILNFNKMTKVHPESVIPPLVSSDKQRLFTESSTAGRNSNPVILAVWKKSLIFNCDGFTVFDTKGNLIFRVDNYAAGNKAEVLLMDAVGRPLLTIRRKRPSLTDSWLVYDGETTVNPRFTVTKHLNILNGKSLAHVSSTGSPKNGNKKSVAYEIEGSYAQRCCVVYDDKRRRVAEMKRKEAVGGVSFGEDVFQLVVQAEIGSTIAMALVVVLEQMFGGSSRRF
ncbi:hypothetical protein L1987_12985 [Smallanthus sonchifolius]|uniref:Uncharacterized protein n=1 Tax=Smallanthus sonchifolius TaxID=185202 RepID=A0ACB9JHC8_9ASTR|nr:hypothetical protein L1987_12985 [Smallanthus sonchifolius]